MARTKEEINAYHRAWSAANRVRVAAYEKASKERHPEAFALSASAKTAKYRARHKEKVLSVTREWRAKNKMHVAEYNKAWSEANAELRARLHKDWREKNKEYVAAKSRSYRESNKEIVSQRFKDWALRNPSSCSERANRRRACFLRATPAWSDRTGIKMIYRAKHILSITFDHLGPLQVDHIFPLQGETVTGLHVTRNLRIITAFANLSKKNRLENVNG